MRSEVKLGDRTIATINIEDDAATKETQLNFSLVEIVNLLVDKVLDESTIKKELVVKDLDSYISPDLIDSGLPLTIQLYFKENSIEAQVSMSKDFGAKVSQKTFEDQKIIRPLNPEGRKMLETLNGNSGTAVSSLMSDTTSAYLELSLLEAGKSKFKVTFNDSPIVRPAVAVDRVLHLLVSKHSSIKSIERVE